MKCERCGSPDLPDHPYDRTFVAGMTAHDLCLDCQSDIKEILEHAVEGGRVNVIDDDVRTWGYWVEDGTRRISTPEDTAHAG